MLKSIWDFSIIAGYLTKILNSTIDQTIPMKK